MRSPEINVVRSQAPSQEAISSKSKKRRVSEADEHDNVISRSFDNVFMAIDRATEVMAKSFQKYLGQKSMQLWRYWTLSQLWWLMPTHFWWIMWHIRIRSLVAQCLVVKISYWSWCPGLRIKKCGISWKTLDLLYFVIMFCFDNYILGVFCLPCMDF